MILPPPPSQVSHPQETVFEDALSWFKASVENEASEQTGPYKVSRLPNMPKVVGFLVKEISKIFLSPIKEILFHLSRETAINIPLGAGTRLFPSPNKEIPYWAFLGQPAYRSVG